MDPSLTRIESTARHRGASPWTLPQKCAVLLWEYAWPLLCAWTPKPFNPWRLFILRRFGATVCGRPFVHPRARIAVPWRIELHPGATVGDRVALYSVSRITLGADCIVAQEAYLCTATHDRDEAATLLTAPITVGPRAFVGARAFVLPGVTIGESATVGACAVVTRDVPPHATVKGNPARP